MIALGFDPGLATAGLAVVDCSGARPVVQVAETVRTPSQWTPEARIGAVWSALSRLGCAWSPAVVGVEDQTQTWLAKSRAGLTSADAALVLRVAGLGDALAGMLGSRVAFISPQHVKIAVLGPGSRSAEKGDVHAIVSRWAPGQKLSEHAADAIAIAVAAARRARYPEQTERPSRPRTRRRA